MKSCDYQSLFEDLKCRKKFGIQKGSAQMHKLLGLLKISWRKKLNTHMYFKLGTDLKLRTDTVEF